MPLRIFFLFALIMSSPAFAKVYKLDYVLAVPGAEPIVGTSLNKPGQPSMHSDNNVGLELTTNALNDEQVEITAKVLGYGTVKLITKLNESATISNDSFTLAVTPR